MNARVLPYLTCTALKTADEHRITIPATLRKMIEQQLTLIDDAGSITLGTVSISEALVDAITAGRDPLDDPAVQRAALAAQLSTMTAFGSIANTARDRLAATLRDNIDELVNAFQKPYAKAGQELAKAHAILTDAGIDDLDNPAIQRAGLDIATANVNAVSAIHTLEEIDSAIGTLISSLSLANASRTGNTHSRFDTGDASGSEVEARRSTSTKVTHWEGVSRGYTVSLATPNETRERVDHANAIQAQADRAQDQRSRDAMSSPYRFTPSVNA
ncbi:MAG: hypothetical protein ACQEWM_06030 [Actinomycetota bacterium]